MYSIQCSFPAILVSTVFLGALFIQAKKVPFAPTPATVEHANRNAQPGDTTSGKKIFITNCAACHRDTAGTLAPGPSILAGMTSRAVLAALDNGKMRQQGSLLSENERKAVAEWLTGNKLISTSIPANAYTPFTLHHNQTA